MKVVFLTCHGSSKTFFDFEGFGGASQGGPEAQAPEIAQLDRPLSQSLTGELTKFLVTVVTSMAARGPKELYLTVRPQAQTVKKKGNAWVPLSK